MEQSSRAETLRAVLGQQKALWAVPALAYAGLAAWRDEAPDKLQPPILADVLTWIPWWVGVIIALFIAIVVLFEGAHREITRLEAIAFPKPTTQVPPVEKGLLDFRVDLEDAGKRFRRVMDVLTKETRRFNTRLLKRSAEWQKQRDNPRKQRRIASRLASDMGGFADRVDQQVVSAEEQGRLLTEGMLGTIKHESFIITEADIPELARVRDSVWEMLESAKQGRGGIAKFREAAERVRDMNMSQDLNAALEQRLVPALDRMIETFKGIESTTAQVVRTIDERRRGLRKSASRKPQRQPQRAP